EARGAVSLDTVLKQLQQLRGENGAGISSTPAPPSGAPASGELPKRKPARDEPGMRASVAAPAREAAALSGPVAAPAGLEELWARLIEGVGRVSPFIRTYLVDAYPVSFAGGVFTIGFDPEFENHLGLVDNSINHERLRTKLAELGHPNAQIKFVKAEAPPGRVPISTPSAAAPRSE